MVQVAVMTQTNRFGAAARQPISLSLNTYMYIYVLRVRIQILFFGILGKNDVIEIVTRQANVKTSTSSANQAQFCPAGGRRVQLCAAL